MENIALIPQDTSLFHRTIKQYFAYGGVNASDKEIINAAKKLMLMNLLKHFRKVIQQWLERKELSSLVVKDKGLQ